MVSVSQKNGASERDPERMRVRVPRELAEAVEKAVADGSYPDRNSVIVAALDDFLSRRRMIRNHKEREFQELLEFNTMILVAAASKGRLTIQDKAALCRMADRMSDAGMHSAANVLGEVGVYAQVQEADDEAFL